MNNYVLGLELLIIGMGTVFLSLYLLSVFLFISGKLFGPESNVKKKADVSTASVKKEPVKKLSTQGFSTKMIAAVTAVIYENLDDQKNYKIISVQKRNQN